MPGSLRAARDGPRNYPQELSAYTLRDPDRIIRQARENGRDLGRFMEQPLSGPVPWAKLRQAQKLLRLGAKYGWFRVEFACRRALAFELINVRRVESILPQDLDQFTLPIDASREPRVLFLRSDPLLKRRRPLVQQSAYGQTLSRGTGALRDSSGVPQPARPDLLIIGDFGPEPAQRPAVQVTIERHGPLRPSSPRNGAIGEWMPLFDDPILGQSALDRLAHNAYQIAIEGDSYRSRQGPSQGPPLSPRRRGK